MERLAPQWRLVAARDDGDASNDAAGDVAQIHTALSRWGENKSLGEVMRVENWLETVLSGKSVAMEQGANTIELCVFNQEQRACFLQTIVPMIARRKDVECFVQEHLRRESDFRITLIGTEETIPGGLGAFGARGDRGRDEAGRRECGEGVRAGAQRERGGGGDPAGGSGGHPQGDGGAGAAEGEASKSEDDQF